VTVSFEPGRVVQALTDDPEFTMAARHWTARVRLFVGPDDYYLDVVRGTVVGLQKGASGYDSHTIVLGAPVEVWEQMMAPVPRPFYQDHWSAFMRHGFTISGDLEVAYSYFAAIRRMVEVLRLIHNEES